MDAITDTVHELKNLNETMTTTTTIRDDECDVMGKHIAIQLRKLPSYDRVLANFNLQKVLMDYRLRNMRRVSPSTSYSRPSSVAYTIQSNPYTPQTTTSEESTTADIITQLWLTLISIVISLNLMYNYLIKFVLFIILSKS